jgi:uncharacterized membrane protein HdeD (DUF308 family)
MLMGLTGVAVLVWPHASLVVMAWLVGITLLVNGVVQILTAVADTDAPSGGRVLFGVLGALSLLVGLLCLRSPTQTLATFALLVGSWWIVSGVLTVVAVAGGRTERSRWWTVALGVLSVLAGAVVLMAPRLSLATLALTLGVALIVLGVAMAVDAVRARHG